MSRSPKNAAILLLVLSVVLLLLIAKGQAGISVRLESLGLDTNAFGPPWPLLFPSAWIVVSMLAIHRRNFRAAMLSASLAFLSSLFLLTVQQAVHPG